MFRFFVLPTLLENDLSALEAPAFGDGERYERWIRNKKVTIPKIIEAEQSRLMKVLKGKHILGIQDTTSYNYQSKSGRKVGLGTLDGKHKGVYMHPMLILDATKEDCLGASSVQFINRTTLPNKPKDERKRDYEKLKIEEKESYRWIQSANESLSLIHISEPTRPY